MCGEGFEFIWCCYERKVRNGRHVGCDLLAPALHGVQAGAYGCAALGQLIYAGQGRFDALKPHRNLMRIAREFLRERQRCRVHSVGAANFNDAVKFFYFCCQGRVQFLQSGDQYVARCHRGGNVHRGRECVV